LESSDVQPKQVRPRYWFVPAEGNVPRVLSPRAVGANSLCSLLLRIAQDSAWLLERASITSCPKAIQPRLLGLLTRRGLATYTGTIRAKKLTDEFAAHYSTDLLQRLQCDLDTESGDNWLLRLLRRPHQTQHPLHYLLLCQFLDHSIDLFFDLPDQTAHFGSGPWPCLNPACRYYRISVISECTVHYSQDSRRPVGTFACSCGFVYSRMGPDEGEGDRYRSSRIESYGLVWKRRLRDLWADPSTSLRSLARQLGIDPKTAVNMAIKAGLDVVVQRK
jgi:hypothetical protein